MAKLDAAFLARLRQPSGATPRIALATMRSANATPSEDAKAKAVASHTLESIRKMQERTQKELNEPHKESLAEATHPPAETASDVGVIATRNRPQQPRAMTPFMRMLAVKTGRIAEDSTVEEPPTVEQGPDSSPPEIIESGPANLLREGAAIYSGYPQTAADSGLPMDPSFVMDESQVAAIRALAGAKYGCLIGAAGTGKTTLVKHLLASIIYGDRELGIEGVGIRDLGPTQGPSIALVAFTGIATQVLARNLPDWIKPAVKTVHSLLEYKPVHTESVGKDGSKTKTVIFLPDRNTMNPLSHDVIVVDEASMLGLDLWHRLLDACRPGTRIILIGDLNQLKPVADQTMFGYALGESLRDNARWVVAELTKIHRQKEAAANRIIDTAHRVLNGLLPEFDDPGIDSNWRVMGYKLKADPAIAGKEIVSIADLLRTKRVNASVDPETPLIYDPYRDRIMTPGNGWDDNTTANAVQQAQINDVLCRLVEPPTDEHPIYIIDAGRARKRFAVGHRVMATKNEAPDTVNRVTNGMTGRITEIRVNPNWDGVRESVGPEEKVSAWRRENARVSLTQAVATPQMTFDSTALMARFNQEQEEGKEKEKETRESDGPASHSVEVLFDNGATRVFSSKAQVEQLMLAYATTVHKAQGSQCDTAIIVIHHTAKRQLNRELLYTAVTRAQKRVVILYTDLGLRTAIAKQQIFGKTLADKIKRYADHLDAGGEVGQEKKRVVRLTVEDPNPFDLPIPQDYE